MEKNACRGYIVYVYQNEEEEKIEKYIKNKNNMRNRL